MMQKMWVLSALYQGHGHRSWAVAVKDSPVNEVVVETRTSKALAEHIVKTHNEAVEGKLRSALEALELSYVALNDWLHQYASEFCNEDGVKEAEARIREAGGTLAYITDIREEIREVLK